MAKELTTRETDLLETVHHLLAWARARDSGDRDLVCYHREWVDYHAIRASQGMAQGIANKLHGHLKAVFGAVGMGV